MLIGQDEVLNEEEQIAFWNGASPILALKLKGKQVMVLCSGKDEPVGQRIKSELERLGVKVIYGSTNHQLRSGGDVSGYITPFEQSALAIMVTPEYKERAEDRIPDNGMIEVMKELSLRPMSFQEKKGIFPGMAREEDVLGSSKVIAINPRKNAPVMRFLSSSAGGIHEFGRLNAGASFANKANTLIK